jgi:ubiquinone/menaquinone biosynthesis C-methylase UbiE
MEDKNARFAGSIPAAYDRYLGPLFFQAYAEDLAARLNPPRGSSLLELACGTGILTRVLRDRLPKTIRLVATDLNEPMIARAATKFSQDESIEWQQADARSLPFDAHSFDTVVCQFGIMFVPDKALAAREARRVLKRGGVFLFNVWDSLEQNPLGQIAHETIGSFFEKDPPTFYQVPFAYHNRAEIERLLAAAGFSNVRIDLVSKQSGDSTVEDAATGLVQGSPMFAAIAERDASLLPGITQAVADALGRRFGRPTFRAPMRAIVVQAQA